MIPETLEQPLILYRHHGYGVVSEVLPIVTRYKTIEDYTKAVLYNLKNRPSNALISCKEIINQGTLTSGEADTILGNIQTGKYAVPETFTNINSLYTT